LKQRGRVVSIAANNRFYPHSARIKISSNSQALIREIVENLSERFEDRAIGSPIMPSSNSSDGSLHTFLTILEAHKR